MSKVYLVSKGEYSSYCVVGVFETEDLAKHAMKLRPDWCRNDRWNDIEEMELNDTSLIINEGEVVIPVYRARVRLDTGLVKRGDENGFAEPTVPEKSGYCIYNDDIGASSTISMDHAVKIAVEARQKWLREKGLTK